MKSKKKRFGYPHRDYCHNPVLCAKIKKKFFQMLNDEWVDDRKINAMLSEEFGIPKTTMWRWGCKWKKNHEFDPSDTTNKGACHRIFTDIQEKNIVDYIASNYIDQGKYFPDFAFETVIFDAYDEIYFDSPDPPKFECSSGFICDFKNRNRISSRLAHFRQRPIENNDGNIEKIISDFKKDITNLIQKASENCEPVVNADETGFQIFPTSIKTWAFKNAKNVSINVFDSDKERISIMASITSDNNKLPLFFIGMGNNEDDAEEQLGQMIGENEFTFSSKSYMNTNCFLKYLEFLRKQFSPDKTIHLILDRYSSHTSTESIKKAESLNIKLYFIPSHFTDVLQPLDIAIFAPLKSMTNAKIRRLLLGDLSGKIGIKSSVSLLQESWTKLSESALSNAWSQYF